MVMMIVMMMPTLFLPSLSLLLCTRNEIDLAGCGRCVGVEYTLN